jgi:hypothetical protein
MGDADFGLAAIQLLLKEYPQAARKTDAYGNLPIHRICLNRRATSQMVRELLFAHPQGINDVGEKGETPYAKAMRLKRLPAGVIALLRREEQGEAAPLVTPARQTHSPLYSHANALSPRRPSSLVGFLQAFYSLSLVLALVLPLSLETAEPDDASARPGTVFVPS